MCILEGLLSQRIQRSDFVQPRIGACTILGGFALRIYRLLVRSTLLNISDQEPCVTIATSHMAATAQQEVDSLDRVLTRLGTTDEGNLEKVCQSVVTLAVSDALRCVSCV